MQAAILKVFSNLQTVHSFAPSVIVFFAHWLPYILLLGLALYLFFAPHPSFWKKFYIVLGSGIASALGYLASLLIQSFYQSPRPFAVIPEITPLIDARELSLASFPSVHATVFFAMGTFLWFYHKRLGVIYLVGASFIALARVSAGVHWPLDILAGAILGIISASLIKHFAASIKRYL